MSHSAPLRWTPESWPGSGTDTPRPRGPGRRATVRPGRAWLAASLLTLGLIATWPASAGRQADRAVEAVRALADSGEIPSDAVLTLVVKQGNRAAFVGPNHELQRQWERQTGVVIDINVMPQQASRSAIERDARMDVTIARNREYPDLYEDGLIRDLTPYANRFGFDLAGGDDDGYLAFDRQALFGDRIVAIPADGDVALLYLRRDLLQDPDNRRRFRKAYGRELGPPETWAQYEELIEFFHRPEDGFYGAAEQRDPATGWMLWLPRYAAQAAPNRFLFDERMRPLVDSPAGVAATKSYLATLPYSPDGILDDGNDYSFTLPYFMRGDAFATIITVAGAKLFNRENAPVADRFGTYMLPGNEIGDRVVRRSTFIYGNNIVVPSRSRHPALAFLYAMWLTDPDHSARSVGVRGGFTDPYRANHLDDPRIRDVYTPEALDRFAQSLDIATPAGTGLPGDTAYIEALNRQLSRAARGRTTAREAMERVAAEWERITERQGREQQIRHWRTVRERYPEAQ